MDVLGLAISNGEAYSSDSRRRPTLCIGAGFVVIRRAVCPAGTLHALAGNRVLLEDGRFAVKSGGKLHPRTAVALDGTGTRLWLIVVDGRQRNYSEGVTLAELARIARNAGAHEALNLDGGGSSTLVILDEEKVQVENSPIHKRVPMWQRPVANPSGCVRGNRCRPNWVSSLGVYLCLYPHVPVP